MTEDGVEFSEYFSVVWRGKWIIAACVVVALLAAAGLTRNRPIYYFGAVSYSVCDRLWQYAVPVSGVDAGGDPTNSPAHLNSVRLLQLLKRTDTSAVGADIELAADEKEVILTASAKTSAGRSALDDVLSRLDALFRSELLLVQSRRSQAAVEGVTLAIGLLSRQRDLLLQQASAAPLPADARPYMVQKAVDAEAQILAEQVRLDALRSASVEQLSVLEMVGAPMVTVVEESRFRALVIAGLLGLCAGVLLSFLARQTSRRRRQTTSR